MSWKPDGYTSLSPYLVVEDARGLLDFVGSVFGSEPLRLMRRDDGGILHAEVRIDDTIVMISEAAGWSPAHLHVYLADPEAAFARAVEAGASVVEEVTLKDDGDRRGGVRDASGTTWWLARTSATQGVT